MQTKKQAYLAAYRGEKQDYIPAETKCTVGVVFPGDRFFGDDEKGDDWWGVNWTQLGPDPGIDGSTVSAGFKLFEDMDEWQEKVKFPKLDELPVKDILKNMKPENRVWEENASHVLILSGTFERMNQLIGMENALCAFYDYPDEVKAFFDALCEYKMRCIDLAYEAVKPDIIHMHDDWGSSNNMIFSPEIWREFLKPIEKKYADHIHRYGMLYEHHSCGYITQIIPDLVEIGVDCINPLNICNNLEMIEHEYGDKITLKGGVDNQRIDIETCNEIDIRKEARRVIDIYGKSGRYVPGYVYANRRTRDIFMDEVEKYGKMFLAK